MAVRPTLGLVVAAGRVALPVRLPRLSVLAPGLPADAAPELLRRLQGRHLRLPRQQLPRLGRRGPQPVDLPPLP